MVRLVLRAIYVDLDGTLLGPRGSLFAASSGGFTLDGARALQVCDRAGVEVVLCSGRRQHNVFDVARLIGQRSYIFELGAGLVLDDELEWLTDGLEPSAERGTIWTQIRDSGAPELLVREFPGRLEEHWPWAREREVSHLYRGEVDCADAAALLDAAGLDWLRLVDNGVISQRGLAAASGPTALAVERVHVYHLGPRGASKLRAIARHMQNRGFAPDECIAIGDSREDLDAASVVGNFWLVANALERDPDLRQVAARYANVRLAAAGYGAGVYEAAVTTLAQR